jgi:hypothetical protein
MKKPLPLAFTFIYFASILLVMAQDRHNFPVPPKNTSCDSISQITDNPDILTVLEIIGNTDFRFQQNIKINRETGFKEASFFSCDNSRGYMVIIFHDGKFLYPGIPKPLWEGMIDSGNPSDFYEQNIKYRYVYSAELRSQLKNP